MRLNRQHRDFPEFEAKWNALVAQYKTDYAEAEAKAKADGGHGFDCQTIGSVTKRFHQNLTALQKEYQHLYTG